MEWKGKEGKGKGGGAGGGWFSASLAFVYPTWSLHLLYNAASFDETSPASREGKRIVGRHTNEHWGSLQVMVGNEDEIAVCLSMLLSSFFGHLLFFLACRQQLRIDDVTLIINHIDITRREQRNILEWLILVSALQYMQSTENDWTP